MTNREKEEKIRTAVCHAAPDQLKAILSSCTESQIPKAEALDVQKERLGRMRKKERRNVWAAALAAAVLLVCVGGYSLFWRGGVDSVILLDVNPSLSLSVNAKERVLSAEALNEDARDILGSMDLKGTSLEVALNALVGSMLQKGYLGEAQNSILVSVENDDAEKGRLMQQKVSEQIARYLQTDSMDAAVLSQTVSAHDTSLEALAKQYGISVGKAALIQEVVAQDETLAYESLVPMTINEIALIASSRDLKAENVVQSGTASSQGYIGADSALDISCGHAGVSVNDIYGQEVEFDSERGLMIYEVEFQVGAEEYEYHIDAATGEVLWSEHHPDDDWPAGTAGTGAGTSNAGTGTVSTGTGTTNTGAGSSTAYIGSDAALSAAYTHAGITDPSSAFDVKSELDDEHGQMIYEVEFQVGAEEYEYHIDAVTGEVLWSEHHPDDDWPTGAAGTGAGTTNTGAGVVTGHHEEEHHEEEHHDAPVQPASQEAGTGTAPAGTSSYIGSDAALSIAYTHAGIADPSAAFDVKSQLDDEDGRMVYEVEFQVGALEYDYEIDASTGEVLKAETDRDD